MFFFGLKFIMANQNKTSSHRPSLDSFGFFALNHHHHHHQASNNNSKNVDFQRHTYRFSFHTEFELLSHRMSMIDSNLIKTAKQKITKL